MGFQIWLVLSPPKSEKQSFSLSCFFFKNDSKSEQSFFVIKENCLNQFLNILKMSTRLGTAAPLFFNQI